jgi:hypothetical protein
MVTVKKVLIVLMAIGAAAYFGGGGTFASFNAETTNAGTSVAAGTLTLENNVNSSATSCLSANGASANNVNAACDSLLTLTNVAPGVYGGVAKVVVQNSGSIDASKFYLWAANVGATLTQDVTKNTTPTVLHVSPLQGTIASGNHVTVSYGSTIQQYTVGAAVEAGATLIPVSGPAASQDYPAGTIVASVEGNSSAAVSNCYDTKTTVPGTAGATKGTDLNFNPTANNPFCGSLLFFVQETTGGKSYCWYGNGSSPEATTGYCTAPISVNPSATLSTAAPITALPVSALNGNVTSGDSIVVKQGVNTQTFTASGNATFGATSIPVTSATPNFAYTAAASVTDSTTLGTLNGDQTYTVTNFDTQHNGTSGKIPLYQVSSNGQYDTNAVQLSHFQSGTFSRTFEIGLYVPAPAGINQNYLQGLSSTFGITWHIDQ